MACSDGWARKMGSGSTGLDEQGHKGMGLEDVRRYSRMMVRMSTGRSSRLRANRSLLLLFPITVASRVFSAVSRNFVY